MSKTAFAIRHLHFEDLGSLAPLLRERGYAVHELDAADTGPTGLGAPGLAEADLLILLGGPLGAFDEARYPAIATELALVRQRLAQARPLLGICLGAQLIARALGARVAPMAAKEIGFAPLQLTAAGQASALAALGDTPVLHWHGDQFELPPGAELLAASAHCPHQAFARGPHTLGLQCHLEAEPRHIERWLIGHALELAQAGIAPEALRGPARALQDRLPEAARAVLGRWLDGLDALGTPA